MDKKKGIDIRIEREFEDPADRMVYNMNRTINKELRRQKRFWKWYIFFIILYLATVLFLVMGLPAILNHMTVTSAEEFCSSHGFKFDMDTSCVEFFDDGTIMLHEINQIDKEWYFVRSEEG